MKAKVLISAVAALAMFVPSTAVARDFKHRTDAGNRKHRTELGMAHNGHHNMAPTMGHRNHRVAPPMAGHRHSVGTRFVHRPINGRFVHVNRERLWLADNILYRVVTTPHGTIYIVVGYWR